MKVCAVRPRLILWIDLSARAFKRIDASQNRYGFASTLTLCLRRVLSGETANRQRDRCKKTLPNHAANFPCNCVLYTPTEISRLWLIQAANSADSM